MDIEITQKVDEALAKAIDAERDIVYNDYLPPVSWEDSRKIAKTNVLDRGYDDLNHRYDLFNEQHETEQYNQAKTYFESL